jgi:Uma2 family endonuclease
MTLMDSMLETVGRESRLYRLSVEQYEELVAAGTLGPEDNVELLEGMLVRKMSKNDLHAYVTEILSRLFYVRCATDEKWRALSYRNQNPVSLGNSVPEPDGVLVRGVPHTFLRRKPTARDVAVVFEVSESSLSFDRNDKSRVYAAAQIPVYVIVNLIDMKIEVYHLPKNEQYELFKSIGRGERMTLPGELEIELVADEILPPEAVGGAQ